MNNGPDYKNQEKKEITFANSLKSSDTEEWWDLHFNRPIGFLWAKCAIPLHITPNMITIASIFIGTIGGWLFFYDDLKLNIIGMVLLTLANTFDSADGQLARLTGNKTRLGRLLDGLASDFWFFAIYLALVLRLTIVEQGNSTVAMWILAVLAGGSHILAACMADYYRNIHLYFTKGSSGSEHDTSAKLKEECNRVNFWKQPIDKISLWGYSNYTKTQEFFSPKFQSFWKTLTSLDTNQLPPTLFEDIRQKNKKYMPLTNILQFNTRVMFLFFTLFIDMVWLYFLFDIFVMGAILVYLVVKEEKLFGAFDKQLKGGVKINI